jgi:LPXTG-motif cell wall-anchored protein
VTFSGQVDLEDIKQWTKTWRQLDIAGMYRDFPDGGPTGAACELLVGLPGFRIHLDKGSGEVSGSFTLGSHGNCFQEQRSYPAYPGRYYLTAGCMACVFGEYQLTAGTLPATGGHAEQSTAVGITLLVLGAVALALARRRRRPSFTS